MAEVQEAAMPQNQVTLIIDKRKVASLVDSQGSDLSKLKLDLEGYRQLLLPLNKFLEWEENHYPAILVGSITFLFAIIWYLEPSVLTCFSLVGLVMCLTDFTVPTITSYFFATAEWTVVQERQFEVICQRILNAKTHIGNAWNSLMELKNDKPKAYLLVMMGIFAVLAWIGSLIDNLLLTYLLVIFVVNVPGLRKHGILQRFTASAGIIIKRMVAGAEEKVKAPKTKTN